MMILDPLIGGIAMGCIHSLIALGYNMLIRAMNLLHFAQGEVVMLGAMFGITAHRLLPLPFAAVLIAGMAFGGLAAVAIELGSSTRLAASAKYYVHIMATLGTLAEKDAEDAGDAVFGREQDTTGLSALGRRLFRTVIKVSDYLQSVSAESTTKKTQGSELLKP